MTHENDYIMLADNVTNVLKTKMSIQYDITHDVYELMERLILFTAMLHLPHDVLQRIRDDADLNDFISNESLMIVVTENDDVHHYIMSHAK